MQIKITGKNLDIGESLREHIDGRLRQLQSKYFEGAVHGHVTVEKQRVGFHSDCTLHLATGLVLQAHGQAGDALASFEATAQHLERQLRRYKQRIKEHHKSRRQPVRQEMATSYVISGSEEKDEERADLNPVVIAEQPTSVPELTVGEALMQLDISSVPFVLFRNSGHGTLNVVYRRHDGNIGWVDPRPSPSR